MADLTVEELADIAKIQGFRKPHTLAKFDLTGKSEAVIAAYNIKKAEFDAAGLVDDGKDDEEPVSDEAIIAEVRDAKTILDLYAIREKYPERSQAVEDAINARGNEIAGSAPSAQSEAPDIAFVKMVRDPEQFPAGPHEAKVHPDEVQNFRKGGWVPEG